MSISRTPGFAAAVLALAATTPAAAQGPETTFDALMQGRSVHGFRTEAVYLDAADRPMGARFVHARTGFTLDLVRIQSVPQAFMWVNSYPTSDMGEPHTQEHLLLGKGNKGRFVADLENMSLAVSSAFVQQPRTAYHFHTSAGPEVFYDLFEKQLDALLYPDYTDEEIRREVRNFGVTENADGSLRVEEKGTVYNEMVSSFERPFGLPYRAVLQALYGAEHPLSYSAGGFPAAIREMQPEHIRRFHADHYQLGNMGVVASVPREMTVDAVLRRIGGTLDRLQGDRPVARDFMTEARLPRPQSAPAGEIRIVDYPHQNPQQPSPVILAWAPERDPGVTEQVLLDLFAAAFAGDPTTNLYRIFVDGNTREIDVGARGVGAWTSSELGRPVFVSLSDVSPAHMTEARVAEVRERILQELRTIAAWEDGSPELEAFNARVRSRVTELRRGLSDFVNSPPGFGNRNTSSGWVTHLDRLNREADFRKSLTLGPQLAEVERLLASGTNVWREHLARWRMLDAVPYAVASRPSPELIAREEAERRARADAELRRLMAEYGTTDEQEAIRRYRTAYDAETARLDAIAAGAEKPGFVDSPPMTLDDQLDYRVETLAGGVPLVASTFDNMTSATVGLALRLDAVAPAERVLLAALPQLMTQVGVIRDGVPMPFVQMREAMRQEILRLNAFTTANPLTGRVELVVRGAGNDLAESRRAVGWMRDVLLHPDWRPENLPRIRDVVDQTLAGLRNTTQGSEESWVNDPAAAYRMQHDALFLATQSFQTRTHNVHRLRWMLKEAPAGADGEALDAVLAELAGIGGAGTRDELRALLGAVVAGDASQTQAVAPALRPHLQAFGRLPEGARAVAVEVARDLELSLADVPDGALAGDWRYLTLQMRADLRMPPADALAALDGVRRTVLAVPAARTFMIGSGASQEALRGELAPVLAALAPQARPAAPWQGERLVDARLRARAPQASAPVFVALVNPNTQGGVFLHSAPLATYADTDRESLLRFLAARTFGGGGAHSMFMKTWGAGLAYSNGLRGSPETGRLTYYAERVPELPQTLRFVIDELRAAQPDPAIVEYAVAQAFAGLRSAQTYELRGEAMAADLADGQTPEKVRAFRQATLALRGEPGLVEEVFGRLEDVYGRVLPGYGPASAGVDGAIYFVIGPENQLRLYEDYLRSAEGPGAVLHRLYGRDFWVTAEGLR
jgi:Zn-dependent M16 (insulinase) family peptidase